MLAFVGRSWWQLQKQDAKFVICFSAFYRLVRSRIWIPSNTKRVGDTFLPPLLLFLLLIGQKDGRTPQSWLAASWLMRRNAPHAACTQYELHGTPCKCVPHTLEVPLSMNHMGHNDNNILRTHNKQFDMHLILCPICLILSVERRRLNLSSFGSGEWRHHCGRLHESPMREMLNLGDLLVGAQKKD